MFGELNLFCAVCGCRFRYSGRSSTIRSHHQKFGVLCSMECLKEAELKYARLVLGKSEPETEGHPK